MTRIIGFPREWERFASCSFYLSSINSTAASPFTGRRGATLNSQIWRAKLTMSVTDKDIWMPMEGMFAELAGQSGLLSMYDPVRKMPQLDLEVNPTISTFSDGSRFSDGFGWSNGYLAPNIYATTAAVRGDTSLVVGGLPVSTARVMRRGDHFEIRRNGMADATPSLHMVVRDAPTDASGHTRLEFRPALRAGVAAGDQVALRFPSTVFRVVDDNQGIVERSPPHFGNLGFELIEALA